MENKRKDRRVQMSKSFLKDALITLLKEKHISHITVIELCNLADVNRSTFYAHYSDIYELLTEIENDIMEQLSRFLQLYVENAEDPMTMTEKLIEFIGQRHEACEVLLSTNSNISFEEKIRTVAHQYLLVDQKDILMTDERLFEYVSAFIISGSIEVVKTWLKNGRDRTAKDIAHLITELSQDGMLF